MKPWKLQPVTPSPPDEEQDFNITADNGWAVGVMFCEPHARLVASAPVMQAVLQRFVYWAAQTGQDDSWSLLQDARKVLRLAVSGEINDLDIKDLQPPVVF